MASQHPKATSLLKQGTFDRLTSFKQFESRVAHLKTTKELGDAFQILVEVYLHTQPKMQASEVCLVGQIAPRIRRRRLRALQRLGFGKRDRCGCESKTP